MELYLQNTTHGLIPLYDDDYEEKRRLKIGEVYKVSIKKARNYEFHKKYFALIKCSWEYLNEKQQRFFGSINSFRKAVQIAAGFYEPVFNIKKREWTQESKSISFDKMDEYEFRELYDRSKDVIFEVFLHWLSIEEFDKELINF